MSRYSASTVLALVLIATPAGAAPLPAAAIRPPARTEVHVVAVHEGVKDPAGAGERMAAVLVDRPNVEVTLVLSAYNSVNWIVTATPKTKITKVILAGYESQGAAVPAGAQVVRMFHEGRTGQPYLYFYYKLDSPRFRPAVQGLYQLTGKEIRSFRGTYQFDAAAPLTVDGTQDDPRLASDYPKLTPATQVAKVKFQAVHLTPTSRFDVAGAFGEFTQTGPDRGSLRPLPTGIRRLAFDPNGKKYYGLTTRDVHEVDLAKQTTTKMELDAGLPRFSWPRAITFDTKANRLLVVASKAIYEYDPATRKWRVLVGLPRGLDLAALTYHPADNTLYGLGQEFASEDDRGRPILYRLNAKGAIVNSSELPAPMFPGLIGRTPDTGVQLISAGGHLAVIVRGPAPRDGNGKPGKAESFLFLIDPGTDKVTLGWKE